jgi:hypothetical protein
MGDELICWRCGASLAELSLPLSRMDECPACDNHLHVCRMCVFYDPHVPKACREDDAEDVKEKERANFCDYFKPRGGAWDQAITASEQQSKTKLETLFGDGSAADSDAATNESLKQPESLFGNDDDETS